jgi:D-3-phosphoglycerate dehydrogenase / 2-oxoglutarate reductase
MGRRRLDFHEPLVPRSVSSQPFPWDPFDLTLPSMDHSPPGPSLLFDFDSTLVQVEGADELFAETLANAPDRDGRLARFREITDQGMAGEIPYEQSLRLRVGLLRASRADVARVGEALVDELTPSVHRNRDWIVRNRSRIWIVSGGFHELIAPVATELGIAPARILAHRFRWSAEGFTVGVDPGTALARGGKPAAVREAGIPAPIWVIGDGATDLELREVGLATHFFAFVENRRRSAVVEAADGVLERLEDLPDPAFTHRHRSHSSPSPTQDKN